MNDGLMETALPRRHRELHAVLPLGVALLVAVVVAGWLLLHDGASAPAPKPVGPVLVAQARLTQFAAAAGHPVYWAGPAGAMSYELTQTPSGRVYVRYLPAHTAAGDPRANFLTVGTYPSDHAYADLERAAKGDDVVSARLGNGALMVVGSKTPTNVYLAYPNLPYQIEVFDPSGETARELALAGKIEPIR
jgi:hypothetical protein